MTENNDANINIIIKPKNGSSDAVPLHSVLEFLKGLSVSYKNYFRIELMKNETWKQLLENSKLSFDEIFKQFELNFVDLKFSSFGASIAPQPYHSAEMFNNDFLRYGGGVFGSYKSDIFETDYSKPNAADKFVKRYTPYERNQIFKPIYKESVLNDLNIHLANSSYDITSQFNKPSKKTMEKLVTTNANEKPNDTVLKIALIEMDADNSSTKKGIKKVIYTDKMEGQAMPYAPDKITYDKSTYSLSRKLDSVLTCEDSTYFIRNEEFNITVWGDTPEEAIDAFNFTFDAMYKCYAMEDNERLDEDSIKLKHKLLALIQTGGLYEA